MRVAIVGTRDWPDPQQVVAFVASLDVERDVIVSGHGGVVDLTAEWAADGFGFRTSIHPADWKRYGRAAGPRRNAALVADADAVYAWWDGTSRGTLDTIKRAQRAGKLRRVTWPDGSDAYFAVFS